MDMRITGFTGAFTATTFDPAAELANRRDSYRRANWRALAAVAPVVAIPARVRPEVAAFGRTLARLATNGA